MKNKFLTYDDVKLICEKNESFKMKHQRIGNSIVAQCTYFLASAGDFFDAHNDKSMIDATELRGITFIKEDGYEDWKRYLFLDKFFNINQCNGSNATYMNLKINEFDVIKCNINKLYTNSDKLKTFRALDLKIGMTVGEYDRVNDIVGEQFTIISLEKEVLPPEHKENSWMYDDVKDLKITRVANKDDGSAIRFLMLNGDLVAKTKFSLEAEQTQLAMSVVNANEKLKAFILKTLDMGLCALFEIVSPFNKVVLPYTETALKLLQLRVEDTMEYLNIYNHDLVKEYDILCADEEELYILDKLLDLATSVENKEGWVITFENGKMAKIKSRWYMNLHGILTDGLKEHKLINKILNEEIDDVLAFIPVENIEERDFIDELSAIVIKDVNHIASYCFNTFNDNFKGDKKDFAMKFKSDKHFHYMTKLFGENIYENIEKAVIDDIIFKCRRLELAKSYLKSLGFTRELKLLEDDN